MARKKKETPKGGTLPLFNEQWLQPTAKEEQLPAPAEAKEKPPRKKRAAKKKSEPHAPAETWDQAARRIIRNSSRRRRRGLHKE